MTCRSNSPNSNRALVCSVIIMVRNIIELSRVSTTDLYNRQHRLLLVPTSGKAYHPCIISTDKIHLSIWAEK